MPRFIGFGGNLLIDVDSVSVLRFEPDETTVYFDLKDGTQMDYRCEPEQWKRLRGFLASMGMISEI